MTDRKELETKIAYPFLQPEYLEQALTHKSFGNENKLENNERFEFMGDAILQFIISEFLMTQYPHLTEGEMSKFRAVLVSERGLSLIAAQINLGLYIYIGKGEATTGGRSKKSILADTLEAIFAAIYFDSHQKFGVSKVRTTILHLFASEFEKAEISFSKTDYKTDLQEWVQQTNRGTIEYRVVKESGPDHDKEFVTTVFINDKECGTGQGKSKKISEKKAAKIAFRNMKEK